VSGTAVPGRAPRQTPYRRVYSNGRQVWIARYRDLSGRTRYAKPRWHGAKSSFDRKADAQRAIDQALEQLRGTSWPRERVGAYFQSWLLLHPRSERTNKTHAERISRALEIEIEGRPLAEWKFDELRRHQVLLLLDHLLQVEGRAAEGARGIIAACSAMAEDAIGDDAAVQNAFSGVRLRANDPRIRKPRRTVRIWSFEQMRRFARGGQPEVRAATRRPLDRSMARYSGRERFYPERDYEAVLLTPGLTGLRLGEVLGLRAREFDGRTFHPHCSAHEGELVASSAQKNHERSVPVPPTLAGLIARLSHPAESEFLFPTPTGKLWRERNFYRDVWTPAKLATGLDPTPHELRHSYVTHLRAAGIDDSDLALVVGHSVETMVSVYVHALERSHEAIRGVIG
jgi:integrase